MYNQYRSMVKGGGGETSNHHSIHVDCLYKFD